MVIKDNLLPAFTNLNDKDLRLSESVKSLNVNNISVAKKEQR